MPSAVRTPLLALATAVVLVGCQRGPSEAQRLERLELRLQQLEQRLNAPNDVVCASDGSIYFTDLPRHKVYQITRQGQVRVVAEVESPNGVALSANQQHLYIAGMKRPMVTVHKLDSDGKLQPGKDFAPLRVDGLKTDESGNVWMASGDGIEVYNKNAEPLGKLPVPERPSNCGFSGGALYITAQKSVYQIQTKVSGTRTF